MNRVLFSSASDHWSTPDAVHDALNAEFHFSFDPCPLKSSFDGSKARWHGRVFCNPPYSKIGDFMRRGLCDLAERHAELLVFLLPARTGTAWFHDYCLKASEIRFIRGRLRFGGVSIDAPFDSMIVIFREWTIPSSFEASP